MQKYFNNSDLNGVQNKLMKKDVLCTNWIRSGVSP